MDERPSDSEQPAMAPMIHDGPQTGVKGVLADYRQHQLELSQQRKQQEAAAKAALPRHQAPKDLDKTMFTADDELSSDEEFEEYRAQRMAEFSQAAKQAGFGMVRDVLPAEYVDIVEKQADSHAHVAVLLVNGNSASRRLAELVSELASSYTNCIFLRVQAHDCGFSDNHVIPTLLVYQDGQLVSNLVRVIDRFDDPDNFGRSDVAKLLSKSCSADFSIY
ncbi:hypothetical protein LPJ78_000527 [Coemansia sp. RSA 989]|nr:hypothetical protein LPJ78_000527 [Coemansia sp. RSA 989]